MQNLKNKDEAVVVFSGGQDVSVVGTQEVQEGVCGII